MALVLASLLAGCATGPDYQKPAVETPATFKEAAGNWVVAQPKDGVPKGKWWAIFDDPVLDGLLRQVSVSNQTLAASEARYRQARAAVQGARAGFFPTIGASAGASRSGRGEGGGGTIYSAGLDARWEIDLWGRIRREVEASQASAEASAADLESARLSLQAELAIDYFQLRVTDVQRELLEDTLQAFQGSLRVTRNRYEAGVAARADVVQAETQLRSTEAQALELNATRAQLEHAIAVLVGKPPAAFSLEPRKLFSAAERTFEVDIPRVPPGLPSTMLERRPDVAAAERRMAAANARVGVAQAAYFPSLSLTGSGGFASGAISTLFTAPARVWSLGLGLAGTLLDFGARSADVEVARASYDEQVALYRQAALDAFQEVEDQLAALRWLAEESAVQQEAARLARESVVLTTNQYKAGTVGYLNLALAQATQLNAERQAVAVQGRRLAATVGLLRALGGGWAAD